MSTQPITTYTGLGLGQIAPDLGLLIGGLDCSTGQVQAYRALEKFSIDSTTREAFAQIAPDVEGGATLAEAINKVEEGPWSLPIVKAVIRQGEKKGELVDALFQLFSLALKQAGLTTAHPIYDCKEELLVSNHLWLSTLYLAMMCDKNILNILDIVASCCAGELQKVTLELKDAIKSGKTMAEVAEQNDCFVAPTVYALTLWENNRDIDIFHCTSEVLQLLVYYGNELP